MTIKPTSEQEYSIDLSKGNRVVKVEAGAGCGKSSTLAMIANANCVPSLYLTFNKTLADEAKEKFPSWVECRTTHSLAYAKFGVNLAHKLKRPIGAYQNVCGTGSEIARYYSIRAGSFCSDDTKIVTAAGMGIAVKETVARFEQSADNTLNLNHVSFGPVAQFRRDETFRRAEYANLVLSYAQLLWKERINPVSKILATHDTYLKLYQLSCPDLSGYEFLYLDESQDSNDCVIDIVKRQKNCTIVLVGDDAQTLYEWRGSSNAMQKFDGAVAQLTMSFRFGPAIAEVARNVLSLRSKGGLSLQGADWIESQVVPYLPNEVEDHTICHLYRTNSALIADAVQYILDGKSVSLEIDVRDFINMLNSAVALKNGDLKSVKHEEILPYPTWQDLAQEVKHVGGDLNRIHGLIEEGRVEQVLEALANYKKPANPDLILTTAHKSKGREFRIVILADDFPSPYDEGGEYVGLPDSEVNLLYVASTRAIDYLVMNKALRDILTKARSGTATISNIQVLDGEAEIRHHMDKELLSEVA